MKKDSNSALVPFRSKVSHGQISGIQSKGTSSQSPPTLLLHSAGGGSHSLATMAAMLRTEGHVLIPDLDGYGQTWLSACANPQLNALAAHRQVIDSVLGEVLEPQQSVVIVGHSMGGFLGLLTAMADKWPVSAVVAIEPVAFSVLDPVEDAAARAEDLEKVMALSAAVKAGAPEAALGDFIGYWGNTEWEALGKTMRSALLKLAPQIARETFAVAHDTTQPDQYKKLNLPVLLLQGADTVAPAIAVINRLQALLQHVEVQRIPNTAHMGPVRQPDVYASIINEFIQCYADVA
jgi:pimeloyl-ACP methyl ester carboxylesterase